MVECCPTCGQVRPVAVSERVASIAARYHTNLNAIRSPVRDKNVMQARKAIIRDMMERGKSYPQIGRYLNRDHTTIMHHARAMGIAR